MKKKFSMRMTRHWNGFPRETLDAQSVEVFKGKLDGTLRNMV